jgi:hypothetical protein
MAVQIEEARIAKSLDGTSLSGWMFVLPKKSRKQNRTGGTKMTAPSCRHGLTKIYLECLISRALWFPVENTGKPAEYESVTGATTPEVLLNNPKGRRADSCGGEKMYERGWMTMHPGRPKENRDIT